MATPFLDEGFQRNVKAMAQLRKPGGHGKVERFPTLLIKWFGFHALPIFKRDSRYSSNVIFFVCMCPKHCRSHNLFFKSQR